MLSVYKRPHDPKRPVVCTGEMPRQLTGEVRTPLPMETGKPKRHDYHYKRNGVVNLFMFPVYVPRAAGRLANSTGRLANSDDQRATDQN